MAKQARDLPLPALTLDAGSSTPLHRQIYFEIRNAILDGRLRPGIRLPASRALARDLTISRNTVTTAFDQLVAEGYVEARTGAGSFVPANLPKDQTSVERKNVKQHADRSASPPSPLEAGDQPDVDGGRTGGAQTLLPRTSGGPAFSF